MQLRSFPPGLYKNHFIIIPGATISRLHNKIQATISQIVHQHPDIHIHIILCAGICDLTQIIRWKGAKTLVYNHSDSKVSCIIKTMEEINSYYMHHHLENITIQFWTIPPADILKCKNFLSNPGHTSQFSHDIKLQQLNLENDVRTINDIMYSLNLQNNLRTITWHRDLSKQKCRKRGR